MREYTVALIVWAEAETPEDAAQDFIDYVEERSWIVQVDSPDGIRRYIDVVPTGIQRDGTDLPSITGVSRLRICPECEGKVEVES